MNLPPKMTTGFHSRNLNLRENSLNMYQLICPKTLLFKVTLHSNLLISLPLVVILVKINKINRIKQSTQYMPAFQVPENDNIPVAQVVGVGERVQMGMAYK